MLTYEALVAHAETGNMPGTKMRGVLREYLQILILKIIYGNAAGGKLFFTGGTYLRMVHGLKRFSEDLDFNSGKMTEKQFNSVIGSVCDELKRYNISCTAEFKHRKSLLTGSLLFPKIEKDYGIKSGYTKQKGITIKIETNKPAWKINAETEIITGFGEMFPCACTQKGALFADKIDALVKKDRARHLYDIIFMMSNGFPVDKKAFASLGYKDDPVDVILTRVQKYSNADLKSYAGQLRPFLFDDKDADLILNAKSVMPALAKKYLLGQD